MGFERNHEKNNRLEEKAIIGDLVTAGGRIPDDAYNNLDIAEWLGAKANTLILSILTHAPDEPITVDAFHRLANVLVEWWDSDDEHRRGGRRDRSPDLETSLTSMIEEFLLKTSPEAAVAILQPILDAVDRHPREVSQILQGVIGFEDRLKHTHQFWTVWDLFAERVRRASRLPRIDDRHPRGRELIAATFLTKYWKEDVRHWESLEGHAHYVHELFDSLPLYSTTLHDYVSFLYHVGEQSLPSVFTRIADRLRNTDALSLLQNGNTVFMLETLLRRNVYGLPFVLKQERELQKAVLYLLDVLVETGSSSAYQMRDDFVTPISIGMSGDPS